MPRRHRIEKRKTGEWWSELKYGEAILRGLQRFEKEQNKRKKPTAGETLEAHTTAGANAQT
jgi:hypothetical protein